MEYGIRNRRWGIGNKQEKKMPPNLEPRGLAYVCNLRSWIDLD